MNIRQPTILTNLQRGNVKRESPILLYQRTLHELAAQGELTNLEPHLIDVVDANNMTPLSWAAGYGQNSTVELLLRLGANPNHRSNGGRTALMFAADKGFLHVVRTLIRTGADIDAVDDFGNTPLMYATSQDRTSVVQELLRNKCNLGVVNTLGQTAYSITLSKRITSTQAAIESYLINLMNDCPVF